MNHMTFSIIDSTDSRDALFLRDAHGISSTTGAGFLFVFKAWQQAHSKLRNCCHNEEDRKKDKSVVEVILCTFLRVAA